MTLIMLLVVLLIIVLGLTWAVVKLVRAVEKSASRIDGINDYLLTHFLLNEREKETKIGPGGSGDSIGE